MSLRSLFLLPLLLQSTAMASPLVQWGASSAIVSASQGMTEGEDDVTWNSLVASSPAVGANYYSTASGLGNPNTSGANPVFFANCKNSATTNTGALLINNATDGDDMLRSASYSISGGSTVHSLIVWQRYGSGNSTAPSFGFLSGGDNSGNSVALGSLSATAFVNSNSSSALLENRFVIRLGSDFYISQDVGDFPSGANSTSAAALSIPNPAAATWYQYDPATNMTAVGALAGGTGTLPNFDNLTAVGVWYARATTLANTNINYISFTANGTVTGSGPNTPPVAYDDTAETISGGNVLIPVLANDTDADSDPLSLSAVSTPSSGTAAIEGNQIRFTAPGGFTGDATFTYTVSDGEDTDTATVTVTVNAPPPNTPPVANNDTAATTSGSSILIAVMANDTDADNDFLNLTAVTTPDNGSAAILDRDIQYTAPAGFIGTATFNYTVSDGTDTDTATVTVTVSAPPPNNPPDANNDTAATTSGSSVLIPVLNNDTDADNDTLSLSAVTTPDFGTAGIEVKSIRYTAPAGFVGNATFTYTASDGEDTDTATVTVTVTEPSAVPDSPPVDGKTYSYYFLGNSLSRGLSLASGQDRARLEGIFRARGSRMIFGTQLGAGVNLDEHWVKTRISTGVALQLTHMDDLGETSVTGGANYLYSFFRDYTFAFQGFQRDWNGSITSGNTFDAVILQPYQSLLEQDDYTSSDQAKGFRGDRPAINDFISYASGNNPQSHAATRKFYIYSAWPRMEGIEGRAVDTDFNGVYSFSEFYSAPYTVPTGGVLPQDIGEQVPNRDFVTQLVAAVKADNPAIADSIHLIPVGEVFASVDALIRNSQLPGVADYFTRNAAYYLTARLDGKATLGEAGFTYIYPPGQPANYGSDFIAAQGIKNFYCDKIHMNDQPHNSEDSGTIGAYLAAATIHCVLTGERPDRLTPAEVAAIYEKFDSTADAALIAKLQETIWDVVSNDSRTGVAVLPDSADSYKGFQSAHFTAPEIENRALSGEAADADGDGDPNVLEFFRQTDPRQSGAGSGLAIAPLGGNFTVTIRGLSRARGVLPLFEASSDLANWDIVPDLDVTATAAPAAGMSDFQIFLEGGQARSFRRLNLSYLPSGPATPLVAWGPGTGIVTANQNLTGGSLALDLVNPSSPAPGASYQTDSPVFHAAVAPLESGVTLGSYRITDDASSDNISLTFTKNAAVANSGSATFIWQQPSAFLNGADTGNVTLGRLRVRAKQNSTVTGVTQMRFVIRKGGSFYISDDCGAISSNTFYEDITLANPAAVQWHAFDPAQTGTVGAPVHLVGFDGVTAVGFNWRVYADGATQSLFVSEFSAERVTP